MFGPFPRASGPRRRPAAARPVARPFAPAGRVQPLERRTLLAVDGPLVDIFAGDIGVGGGTHHEIHVTYTDPDGIDVGDISTDDVTVSGPGGESLPVLGIRIGQSFDPSSASAAYEVAAPGGVFDPSDNGEYTVTVAPGAVRDLSGNASDGATTTFRVSTLPIDGPMVAVLEAWDLTTPGATTHTAEVSFQSAFGVDPATVDPADLVVTRSDGTPLAVTSAGAVINDWPGGGGVYAYSASYTLTPPDGFFDVADNGVYTVSLNADALKDPQGNVFLPATATFAVAIPLDTVPPTATVNTFYITEESRARVFVRYYDASHVDTSTIDPSDLAVDGPGGPLTVLSAMLSPTSTPREYNVTYVIAAPGGTWDAADAGRYTISVPAGAVLDRSGNPVAATGPATTDLPLPSPTGGPDLTVAFEGDPLPGHAVLPGAAGRVRLRVTNAGDQPVAGRVRVRVLALSADRGSAEPAEPAKTVDVPMRLRPGQGRVVSVRFDYPQAMGGYHLVAKVDDDNRVIELNETNVVQTGDRFLVAAPFAGVRPTAVGAPRGGVISIGRRIVVPVTIENNGNSPFRGDVNIDLFAAAIGLPTSQFVRLGSGTVTRRLAIRPGGSRLVRVSVLVDATLPPSDYILKSIVNAAPASAADAQDMRNAVFAGGLVPAA